MTQKLGQPFGEGNVITQWLQQNQDNHVTAASYRESLVLCSHHKAETRIRNSGKQARIHRKFNDLFSRAPQKNAEYRNIITNTEFSTHILSLFAKQLRTSMSHC